MAVWLQDQNYRVALIDADDQKTSSKWISDIEMHNVEIVTLHENAEDLRAEELRIRINERKRTLDFVVVDTKGAAGLTTSAAVIKSDLTCIPIQPSAADIWPLENALSTVRLSQEVRHGLPAAFLILNQIDHRDIGARQIRKLASKYEIAVATTNIKRLRAYRDAPGLRAAPTRLGGKFKDSALALEQLFTEIVQNDLNNKKAMNG